MEMALNGNIVQVLVTYASSLEADKTMAVELNCLMCTTHGTWSYVSKLWKENDSSVQIKK